jgi:hypothetical protein
MQQLQLPKSVFKVEPPPLWYVTNGELTVGPVVTGLLLRGVEHGRVPEYCHVRTYRGDWRTLNSVREQLAEWGRPVERIKDEMELAHTVTWLSMVTTGAESAMFHYRGRGSRSLITRSVLGPISNERLGYALPESDLLLIAARFGRPVFGPPYGPTEDALAMRFAGSKNGAGAVAMIPLFVEKELTAMLELSRPGHAFRRTDLQRAERIVQRALRQRHN